MPFAWVSVGGLIMDPQKISMSSTLEPVNATLSGKGVFTDMINLRVLRTRDYSGLTGWALNAIFLIRGKQREI